MVIFLVTPMINFPGSSDWIHVADSFDVK